MSRKVLLAVVSALASLGLALGVGVGIAAATEPGPPGGGTCNNYGNGNIIVAPNCGATTPASPSTVTSVRTETRTVTPVPVFCPQIIPQTVPGCPGYGQPFPF